jgi:cell division septation protein DedD
MVITKRPLALMGMLVATLFSWSTAYAVADKTNQGRWEKPTENNAPDKEVPGFLVNLGPTGARAILTERTFIVRYIFKDSPAVGRLKLDDVITGAFGKPFPSHTFGGGPHGYEGPLMAFGEAIESAEAKDGKLVLEVSRGSETIEVKIDLEPIGAFSATFPMQCRKSDLLRAKALKYFADHPDSLSVWQAHARSAVALALLTSDDAKQQALGKQMALKWSTQSPDAGTWTWNLSYQLITLCEYHLLTRDASVLPMIKTVVGYLDKAQYTGKILCWGPTGDKALEKEDYTKVDAAQQLYDGGFGHGPYVPGAGKNGYGPMQYTTILAVTAWQLAGRCGVEANPDCVKRALGFIHRGTNAAGYVAYGGEFTLNAGLVDPVAWKKSTSGDNYVGRAGASLIAHKLSPEFPDSAAYVERNRSYLQKAYKSLPDGHADSNLGIIWGLLGAGAGAGAAEDDAVLRTVLDYHKAFFNMMRCHDGSFVLLPGRDYADNGYYMASRYHPTATMALVLGLSNPKLLIQGIQVSIPGVNPKALKGKMATAYRAIVRKAYGEAAGALKNPGAEDAAAAGAMTAFLEAQSQRAVAELEALEKTGDIVRLEAELSKARAHFGLLDGFKEKIARFEEGLRQDPWKTELKLGANYQQLVAALKRNKSAAYAGDLEKFGGKYPDSLYGKWALEVAREFRSSGSIKDPSTDKAAAGPSQTPAPVTAQASAKPDTTTPAAAPKPATQPAKTAAVSQESMAEYHTRFIRKLDALLTNGAKLEVYLSDWGPKPERYGLRKVSEAGLVVQQDENLLPVPWRLFLLADRAALAKSMAKEDDVEALLIAAILHHAAGKTAEAETFFALASLKDAEAVREARKALAPR